MNKYGPFRGSVLITGGLGTLGAPLAKELRRRKRCEVFTCDIRHSGEPNHFRADVANSRQMRQVLMAAQPTYVYHLAAEFGRQNGEDYFEQLWRTNVIGTRTILELQKDWRFNLIFASSSEVYGEMGGVDLHENLMLERPVIQPNDYAISKWVNECQIMNFEKRYGVECVRLRFFNAYGPGESYHPYRSVVCQFAHHALRGIPLTVYRGYHRVFMYIDDFITTLANVVDDFKAGEVYNIGGAEYRSVEDLARIVVAEAGADPSLIRLLDEDKHNTVSKRPVIDKARADFGHDPKTPLEEGVRRTIAWMRGLQ